MPYTWGQLRLILKQFAPGVSDDQIDETLNARYQEVLDATSWKGLEVDTMLQTLAAYTTGTVDAAQGSATITGHSTNWTPSMVGRKFLLPGVLQVAPNLIFQPQGTPVYTILAASTSQLTLDRPWEASDSTGSGYWIVQNVYDLPVYCKTVKSILSPVTGLALNDMSSFNLDESAGFRFPGEVEAYAVRADSEDPSQRTPTASLMHTVELFPIPTLAQGYPMTYMSSAYAFDGTNTNAYPMAWINEMGLLDGCRSTLKLLAGEIPVAQAFRVEFDRAIAGMLRVEQGHTATRTTRLPERYYRHRMQRLYR